jgi:glutathione S-transferase
MKLVIGDKNYSSWSMRPWLLLAHFDPVRRDRDRTAPRRHGRADPRYSPTGKVPCLIDDHGFAIWDSLAIAETLAERYPQFPMWPADPLDRAHARQLSAEMHAGFTALRTEMVMNVRASAPGRGATPERSPTSRASTRCGAPAWRRRAARSCSANSGLPMRCMRPS